eukprot:TRINITY_DN12353_c0_g1_i4.p1 TRINITY_DN12353_c0_g1~~TRINITY_DN12353_c0_g1_i4.p1  ORF type:complete len:255 (-),score=52.62 TRINITY_DN12353_c0_g1_i4:22-786(-)
MSEPIRLDDKLVVRTVEALVDHIEKSKAKKSKTNSKTPLFEDADIITIMLAMKTIPKKHSPKPHRLTLPHSLNKEAEICIFVKDTEVKNEYKDLFPTLGLDCVKKVIPLNKLKKNYKEYESRRKLLGSYDLFLVDDRIMHLMAKFLGKVFFKLKRQPIPVKLTSTTNIANQIFQARDSTYFYLSTGTCLVVKVATSDFTNEQIVENVTAAINGLATKLPGKWGNIQAIHLKTPKGVALPFYNSLPVPKNKIIIN